MQTPMCEFHMPSPLGSASHTSSHTEKCYYLNTWQKNVTDSQSGSIFQSEYTHYINTCTVSHNYLYGTKKPNLEKRVWWWVGCSEPCNKLPQKFQVDPHRNWMFIDESEDIARASSGGTWSLHKYRAKQGSMLKNRSIHKSRILKKK